MAVVSKSEVVTEEVLMALGEDAFVEVVKGRIVGVVPAGGVHGKISMRIGAALHNYVAANGLGDVFADQTAFVLEGTPAKIRTMRVPDISFITAANLPKETPTGYFYQPPDLAVEIISPHERAAETQAKLTDYFEAGAREVWVVYPELAQIVVHHKEGSRTLGKEDTLASETLLPGFALKLADVFG